MAKKNKVSVDDFAFFEEEEAQPLNIIAKSIQKTDSVHKPKWSQSGAKPEPNFSEDSAFLTNHEPLHKPKWSQSGAKVEPNFSEDSAFLTNHEPQPEPLHKPKWSQSGAKPEPNNEFYSLVGLQKNALIFIFETCLKNGSKISSPISSSNLAIGLGSTVAAVRKAIRRLEEKGFIVRSNFKDGRGGWTKYELPNNIYSELLTTKTRANHEPIMSQSGAKRTTQPEPQPEPKPPYSSSNNFNIITTNTGEPYFSAAIILPNNLSRFGISKNNLQKLVDDNLCSLELVQKSIEALSFDVENGKTGNLASILFGVLRSGKEYISQKYSESLQAELDQELKRIQESEEQRKKLLEIKLQDKFRTHVEQNPDFIETVKSKHGSFVTSTELLEKVAFEEFKSLNLEI